MRKLASVRSIVAMEPIPNADRIEVAVVDGWKCVVKKGEFSVDQKVIYCEIDSLLPVRPEFEFLRASSYRKLPEVEGFRLRTVKLRGQISQGLVLPVSLLGRDPELGEDVTAELGIVKYEAPIPAGLDGEVVGPFPTLIPRTDEERVQNLAQMLSTWSGITFWVSEKLDGTSMTVFQDREGQFGVCGRNWQLAESASNRYWQLVRQLDLPQRLASIGRAMALQGELIGPGIQGNRYRLPKTEWRVFNIFDLQRAAYLPKSEVTMVCDELGLETVPALGTQVLGHSVDQLLLEAEGSSVLRSEVEREGLVWVGSDADGQRLSFKVISNKFLAGERD